MNREDITRMARKAGIAKYGLGWTCWEGQLERFAALVAAHKREWVGLTAYEIQEIHSGNQHWGDFACAIEAKLKEKNHGH